MEPEASPFAGGNDSDRGRAADGSLAGLFRELSLGNMAALDAIYDAMATEMYRLALWRTGNPDDAADVVQSVLVRLAEMRPRLGTIRDPRAYLLAMAHRAAIDRRRGPASRTVPFLEHTALLQAAPGDPDREIDARRASAALERIPAAQREAIFLHHFSGLTFDQIARVTGVPTFTAASRVRNGVRALRRLMGLSR